MARIGIVTLALSANGMLDECLTACTVAIGSRREIISDCVWLYFRFGVSFRDVEELMAARGVLLSYETVRRWCDKFGDVCRWPEETACPDRRQMASGRSLPQDQRRHSLSLASRRSERCRPRYSCAAKAGPLCCHPVLSQAVAGHGTKTARDHYGQTAELRGGETDCDARRCSSTASVPEQPGRELHQPTRERERRMRRFKSARHA